MVAVENGCRALAALETGHFDVVLMDVQMPGMDGFEATAAIRARERGTGVHVPILALTAHAMKGDRERCLEAGMDAYLSKPIQAEALDETIERYAAPVVLDRNVALARADGDLELLHELVGMFREETPALLAELSGMIARWDARGVERAVHSLRGGLAALGAVAASQAAFRLETAARGGDLGLVNETWPAMKAELERLEPALSALTADSRAA